MKVLCPGCGASAREVQNPFYGSGLAVHEYLIDCAACNRVTIEPNLNADRCEMTVKVHRLRQFLVGLWPGFASRSPQ